MNQEHLTKAADSEAEELAYERGARAATVAMLAHCLSRLGYTDESGKAAWVAEREEAVAALRDLCAEHGDNEWTPDLNLADIINKHLAQKMKGLAK